MPFIPHTEADVQAMLQVIGANSMAQLFDEIPNALLSASLAGVPPGMSEMEVTRLMNERALADGSYLNFIGAGAYEHHIPAAVWQIATRGEFYSAYTPYQAEASQGTLQVLYEFQSMMASLTALDVSNASLYDGASALAEAVLMAVRAHKSSKRVLLPLSLHPHYRAVVKAIVANQGITVLELPYCTERGHCLPQALPAYGKDDLAALVIAQPNFFGVLEPINELTDWAHAHGALTIAVVNPMSLALLKPPGRWGNDGADIAVGEGQPLGVPLSGGGPYFGFMCCKQALLRQMPGRIVGRTVDVDGKSGFTLTLQAREQHIRRSKATSNICTNQGLAVTAATIYMSMMGEVGLRRVAQHCHVNMQRLLKQVESLAGAQHLFSGEFFHEAVITLPVPASEVLGELQAKHILAGLDLQPHYPELGEAILVCATETKTEADIQRYARELAALVHVAEGEEAGA